MTERALYFHIVINYLRIEWKCGEIDMTRFMGFKVFAVWFVHFQMQNQRWGLLQHKARIWRYKNSKVKGRKSKTNYQVHTCLYNNDGVVGAATRNHWHHMQQHHTDINLKGLSVNRTQLKLFVSLFVAICKATISTLDLFLSIWSRRSEEAMRARETQSSIFSRSPNQANRIMQDQNRFVVQLHICDWPAMPIWFLCHCHTLKFMGRAPDQKCILLVSCSIHFETNWIEVERK